jgi:hypothetical protein
MLDDSIWSSLIWIFLVFGGAFGAAVLLEVFGWCNFSSLFGSEETEKWDKKVLQEEKELEDVISGQDRQAFFGEASRSSRSGANEDDGGWAIEAADILGQGDNFMSGAETNNRGRKGGCSVGGKVVDCACCAPRERKQEKPSYVPRSRKELMVGEGAFIG